MQIGNSLRPGWLIVAAVLALAGCAPGDLQLSRADLVARSQGIWVAETDSHPIAYHGTAQYALDCLDGTSSSRATGRVSNVAGTWNRPQDYRISVAPAPKGNRVIATVTHIGARHYDDTPWVTVELKALCTGPAVVRK